MDTELIDPGVPGTPQMKKSLVSKPVKRSYPKRRPFPESAYLLSQSVNARKGGVNDYGLCLHLTKPSKRRLLDALPLELDQVEGFETYNDSNSKDDEEIERRIIAENTVFLEDELNKATIESLRWEYKYMRLCDAIHNEKPSKRLMASIDCINKI
jgi:hypothetical protein